MGSQFRYRIDYCHDQRYRGALKRLLRTVFGLELREFDELGFWDPTYHPFSYFAGDEVVSNVSCFDLPLLVAGDRVPVGGIQSGASHIDYRGQGLFRALMCKLLEHCDDHYDALVLYASNPRIYEPYGFQVVDMQKPVAQVEQVPALAGRRKLELTCADDRELLNRLFDCRAPVSEALGFIDHRASFFLNGLLAHRDHIYYVEPEDVAVVCEWDDETLLLHDIVGSDISPLCELLPYISEDTEQVVFGFTPDLMEASVEWMPSDEEETLMVRGDLFSDGDVSVTVPDTAHF